MTTAKLTNVVIFTVGTHNGRIFDRRDLDSMVEAFNSFYPNVPLKFGHDSSKPDGQPAFGWVSRLARDGDRLVADFQDVPTSVMDAIKAGSYRFTSVEILGGVEAEGRTWSWVLDAVALLGADKPAVKDVSDLRALAARRSLQALQFQSRATFSAKSEMDQLREENAKLSRSLVEAEFERNIATGRILPRERELFFKRVQDPTLAEARAWIDGTPKPSKTVAGRGRSNSEREDSLTFNSPDSELLHEVQTFMEEEAEKGRKHDFETATKIVMKRLPDLAKRWASMPNDQ